MGVARREVALGDSVAAEDAHLHRPDSTLSSGGGEDRQQKQRQRTQLLKQALNKQNQKEEQNYQKEYEADMERTFLTSPEGWEMV